MKALRLYVVAFGLFAAASGCTGCTGCADLNTVLMRMTTQQKYLAYQESTFFEDGRIMRTPPAGTVPREYAVTEPYDLREGKEAGAVDGGGTFVAQAPLKLTPEMLAVGQKKFGIYCATCHGALGDGKNLVSANMALRPAPSLHLRPQLPDGQLHDIIKYGYGVMPAYGQELNAVERWSVVGYIRALQLSQNADLSAVPAAEQTRLLQETQQ